MLLNNLLKELLGDFPGSPVVKTPRFHCRVRVHSLVGELRSRMPCGTAKKKKKKVKLSSFKKKKKEELLEQLTTTGISDYQRCCDS